MPSIRHLWRETATAAALAAGLAGAAAAQEAYAFGDSLSDNGNVRALTFGLEAGAEYFEGRFSNGLVWTDLLSLEIAGELQRTNPGLIGPFASGRRAGYNFAHGGAVSGNNGLNFNEFFGGRVQGTLLELLPPFVLTDQAEHFRDQRFFFRRTFRASANDYATISSGGNDYFNGETDVNFVVGAIVEAMGTINENEIENFVVLDLPNVGDIPARFDADNRLELNALSQAHNQLLAAEAAAFAARRGVNVSVVPVGALFDQIVLDAETNGGATFGFTVVQPGAGTTGNCLEDGLVLDACPANYLFYDGIHPTAPAHELISELALATVRGDAATVIDGAARMVAVNQVSFAQNQLISTRLFAAQSGALGSGEFSPRAGALGFRQSGAVGGDAKTAVNYFRFVDGAAPGIVEVTPGNAEDPEIRAASLTLSQGEYVMAYGADAMVTPQLFVGAVMSRSARDNLALDTAREDLAETYAAYAAWFAGPMTLSLTAQGGALEQGFERATGFEAAPIVEGRTRTRHFTSRMDAAYAVTAGPAILAAEAKASVSQVRQFGFAETGGLGLVDRTVPDQSYTGFAGYLGAGARMDAVFSRRWSLGFEMDAGVLAASSEDLGFAALLDRPGLLAEAVESQTVFADPLRQDTVAGLVGAGLTLAGGARLSLSAEADALFGRDGVRPAASLRAGYRF